MKVRARYKFIEFIRPDCYWPSPYTIEQAFGVFAWMIESGQAYGDRGRWGMSNVECLLSCKPTCVNFSEIEPIVSLEDLKKRFHYAILSGFAGSDLRKWRTDNCIVPDGSKIISFPHHARGELSGSEADFQKGMEQLLGATGKLRVQLNPCHADADNILGVQLGYTSAWGWRWVLNYGVDGSVWYHVLARQEKNEPFLKHYQRAAEAMAKLVEEKPCLTS